ncbi:hypothetical protein F938_04497 [Acinetobacter bereziniae LMG 1003 = CIP 70.12]|uniref:Uncharacterized protein n=1 Tax=Acinetobacter bereziniae LMG 1003 = CIP 70.12 TaxID=981324 RepID=N9E3V4_ACIBZ|nr:hypothetical protein F938_04497 [Acinetobacter bereziniae LMG 1003 = CIP 70.12]
MPQYFKKNILIVKASFLTISFRIKYNKNA